jgi:AraC-like DNA-binding protein
LHARANKEYEMPEGTYPPGANDVFQFCYNLKGTSLQKINEHWYVTKPGDFTIFHREDTFAGRYFNIDLPYEKLHVYSLGGHRMGAHIDTYEDRQHTIYRGVNLRATDELIGKIDKMREELKANTTQSWFAFKGYLLEVFTGFARQVLAGKEPKVDRPVEVVGPEKKKWRLKTVDDVKEYIDANYAEDINLTDIARELKLSPRYVSKLFKEKNGRSAIQYLIHVRIMKAKELLREPQLSISEICFAVGCKDIYHFSHLFKRVHGISPRVYRNQITSQQV